MAWITLRYFSEVLGMQRELYAIVPQKNKAGEIGLSDNGNDLRGKCLYLLHGLSDDHTIWMRRTSIERYAEAYGLTVVMPNGDVSFYTDMKHGRKYYTHIAQEIPRIAQEFLHVSGRREDSFIAGLSMGGYGALYNFVGVILKLITNKTYLNPWLFFLYALLLSIPFSVPSLIFGFKGYRGDKKSLYLSMAIYSVDTVLCIPAFLLYNWMDCVLSIIVHAVFLGVMFLALMKRKELIELRNKHMEKVKVDPNLAPKETTVVSFNEFKRNVKNKKTVGEKMEQNKTNTQNKVE